MVSHATVPGSIFSPRKEEESKEERLSHHNIISDNLHNTVPSSSTSSISHPSSLPHGIPSGYSSLNGSNQNVPPSTTTTTTEIPSSTSSSHTHPSFTSSLLHSLNNIHHNNTNYISLNKHASDLSPISNSEDILSPNMNTYNNNERTNTSSTAASRLYTSASIRSITLLPVGSSHNLSRPGSSSEIFNNHHHNNGSYPSSMNIQSPSNLGPIVISEPSTPLSASFIMDQSTQLLPPYHQLSQQYLSEHKHNDETKDQYERSLQSNNQGWNGSFQRRRNSHTVTQPSHHLLYSGSDGLSTDLLDNNVFTISDAVNGENYETNSESSEWDIRDIELKGYSNSNSRVPTAGSNTIIPSSTNATGATNTLPAKQGSQNNQYAHIRRGIVQPSPVPFPITYLPEHFKPLLFRTKSNDHNTIKGTHDSHAAKPSSTDNHNNTTTLSAMGIATANHVTLMDDALRFLLHPIPKLEPVTVIRATITSLPIPGTNGATTYTFWYNPPNSSTEIASPIILMVANRTNASINGPPCYVISMADSILFTPGTNNTASSNTNAPMEVKNIHNSLIPIARLRGTKNGDSYVLYDGGKRSKNILQTIDMFKDSTVTIPHSTNTTTKSSATNATRITTNAGTSKAINGTHNAKPVTHTRHRRRGSLIGLSSANIAEGISKLVHLAWTGKSETNSNTANNSTNSSLSATEKLVDNDNDDNEDIGLLPVTPLPISSNTTTNTTNSPAPLPPSTNTTNTFIATHLQLGHISFETDIDYGMSTSALEKLGISRSSREEDDAYALSRKRGPMVVAIPGIKIISASKRNIEDNPNSSRENTVSTSSSTDIVPSSSISSNYAIWPWPRWETGLSGTYALNIQPIISARTNTWYHGLPDILRQWRYDSFTVGYRHSGQMYILAGAQVPTVSPLYDSKYKLNYSGNTNSTMNSNYTGTALPPTRNRFIRSSSAKSLSTLNNNSNDLSSNSSTTLAKYSTIGMNFCLRDATSTGPSVFMQQESTALSAHRPIQRPPTAENSNISSVSRLPPGIIDNYQDSCLFVRQIGRDMNSVRLDITVRYPLSLVQAFGIILARIDTLTNNN